MWSSRGCNAISKMGLQHDKKSWVYYFSIPYLHFLWTALQLHPASTHGTSSAQSGQVNQPSIQSPFHLSTASKCYIHGCTLHHPDYVSSRDHMGLKTFGSRNILHK